jgi:serine/threonine-protein kinase ATR
VLRPQISSTIAELLQITVRELLLLIQTHALPWLVLTKKKEVIQRIAEARQENEIWRPVIDSANVGPILALLLVQEVPDVEKFAKSRLNEISPHFEPQPLDQFVRLDPTSVALELFKLAGEFDEENRPRVSTTS